MNDASNDLPPGMVEVTETGSQSGPTTGSGNTRPPSAATHIVELVLRSGAEIWHDARQRAYVSLEIGGAWLHLPVGALKKHCAALYFADTGKAARSSAITDAVAVLEASAIYEGELHEVSVRIAGHEDRIYLDLADEHGTVVEITSEGWRTAASRDVPVRFVRRRGSLALPSPARGGHVAQLRSFINLPDSQWPLLFAFIVSCLCPWHPYFILVVEGEAGSGKTTMCKLLQLLVDPAYGELRRPPKEDRDVAIACENSWLLGYDNLSGMPAALSDVLCCVATGGGFATRELYSDADEAIFKFRRPILANGIDSIATRDDLADRSLMLDLPAIDEVTRRLDRALLDQFDAARPQMLGAFLDAVVCALRRRAGVASENHHLPRMADATLWAMAAAPAAGLDPEDVLQAVLDNRDVQTEANIESDPVATGLRKIADGGIWRGTPTELLRELEARVDPSERGARWPKGANHLKVKRRAGLLRKIGVSIEYEPSRSAGSRTIVITPIDRPDRSLSR